MSKDLSEELSKKLCISELKERYENYSSIKFDDFADFYEDIYGEINPNTVRWYIYTLKKGGIIKNVARGHYVLEEENLIESSDFIVITLDIINSSNQNYIEFNENLKRKIEELNDILTNQYKYKRKYFISRGDEIQILYPFNDKLGDLLMTTLCYLHPLMARYAISIGNIDSNEEFKDNSWDMNGPIFWNARDQLNTLSNSNDYNGKVITEYSKVDNICNHIFPLINKSINKISDKQWEAIKFDLIDLNIEEALKELNIKKTSYYDRLDTSNIKEIHESFKAIYEILKNRRSI